MVLKIVLTRTSDIDSQRIKNRLLFDNKVNVNKTGAQTTRLTMCRPRVTEVWMEGITREYNQSILSSIGVRVPFRSNIIQELANLVYIDTFFFSVNLNFLFVDLIHVVKLSDVKGLSIHGSLDEEMRGVEKALR